MARRVLKWAVPVDDRDHPVGSGPVVYVACQAGYDVVQVWTDEPDADHVQVSSARVYGTGQPVPGDDVHVGSTATGPLVWHVFRSNRRTTLLGVPS
jgi:hypothetical protein